MTDNESGLFPDYSFTEMKRQFGNPEPEKVERIDHAAKARYILGHGTIVSAETEAQVHATLALVEQQRIANLIAYMRVQADILNAQPDNVDLAGLQRVADAAWEGLGLS